MSFVNTKRSYIEENDEIDDDTADTADTNTAPSHQNTMDELFNPDMLKKMMEMMQGNQPKDIQKMFSKMTKSNPSLKKDLEAMISKSEPIPDPNIKLTRAELLEKLHKKQSMNRLKRSSKEKREEVYNKLNADNSPLSESSTVSANTIRNRKKKLRAKSKANATLEAPPVETPLETPPVETPLETPPVETPLETPPVIPITTYFETLPETAIEFVPATLSEMPPTVSSETLPNIVPDIDLYTFSELKSIPVPVAVPVVNESMFTNLLKKFF